MGNQKLNIKTEKELEKVILEEKKKGIADIEIGRKYGVTFKYIEKLITKSHGINISGFKVSKKIKTFSPKDFKEEQTSVWSFKQRGNWATHSGEYRGNWSPYIPRNIVLKYSKPGELVLDYFCGAGTTAVECKLLGRKCKAVDINDRAIELAKENLNFESRQLSLIKNTNLSVKYEPELSVGDARNLLDLKDNSVDLICAHPPYANIIHYTDSKDGDLSFLKIDEFLKEMSKVAKESFRVLKPGRQCAILIGDTRKNKHIIPLDNFLLLAHEYLPIFEKPKLSALSVEEKMANYPLVTPVLNKPSLKKKLNEFETTTVWVFPEKDFEKFLNKNVIDRYSGHEAYSTIFFTSRPANKITNTVQSTQKMKKLLFIKSLFSEDNSLQVDIDNYLQKMKDTIDRELPSIVNKGFVVIQTEDIRLDEYIKPLAKRIVDSIINKKLWLKEIIMITKKRPEGISISCQNSKNYLKIDHQYLLVYKVVKGEK
jgi:DNA modification methylase